MTEFLDTLKSQWTLAQSGAFSRVPRCYQP
jgi:hypothetical protein